MEEIVIIKKDDLEEYLISNQYIEKDDFSDDLREKIKESDSVVINIAGTNRNIKFVFEKNNTLSDFIKYLEQTIETFNKYIDQAEQDLKDTINENTNKNRQDRRENRFNETKQKTSNTIKKIEYTISVLNRLITSYRDNDELRTSEEYKYLFYLIEAFVCECKIEDTAKASKEVMKYYVKQSKDAGYEFDILRYFDDEGNVIIETAQELNSVLKRMHATYNNKLFFTANPYFDKEIIVSKEEVLESSRISAKKHRLEKEEKARKLELERKKSEAKQPIIPQSIIKKSKRIETEEEKRIKLYLNYETRELRPNICQKIDLETLISILSNFLDKTSLNKCIEDYNNQLKEIRINRLKRVLSKNDLKKLLKILTTDISPEAKITFEEYISSDEFDKSNDQEVKNVVLSIINDKLLKSTNTIQNFLMFPTQELFDSEIDNIKNSKTYISTETVLNSIKVQLLKLQSHSVNDIKSNDPDAFHVFYGSDNCKQLVIDDKLFGYRYGSRKSKVVYLTFGVHSENISKLQEYYKIKGISNIMLIIGLGNVKTEVEENFYERVKKYAVDNKNKLLEIHDIFTNSFTNETFHKAIELIDSGMRTIEEFAPTIGKQKEIEK